ncbi:S8 family serine peptidase [Couchioplanes caeruleus]|uniref:Type VII secretion-associated serine protease mycosin n=1 Tax=Couchioplanes caeruleus TaxID=56438 RepID=A0A3N1GNX0_9ACTN|nr:S8 family serine peptidase [Couchioplanes caeruleus]ROP31930.1 type VII secretion-associated serine protease mycosin [Couchioplanes caeruleus]
MRRQLLALLGLVTLAIGSGIPIGPALADATRDKQWHLDFLKIGDVHQIAAGSGVTVGVIDSGVSNHADLTGSILSGTDFINKGRDGRSDKTGHGTGMAGLIAAHGRSGKGALGIAPEAKILPVRIFENKPRNAEIGPAINYAVQHGAKVINLSVGGGLDLKTIEAVKAAAEADVVIVASAGNRPQDAGVTAPAVLGSIVAVGAVDRSGKKADVSVTGPALDLMAPGEDIVSTSNQGGYRTGTGTSASAAIVSGAAALLRSKYPKMTAEEVVQRLQDTATDKGAPGVDDEYGHGVVDIVAALRGEGGSASGTQTSSAPAAPSGPAAPTPGAAPGDAPTGDSTPLAAGGVLAVLVAGLVAVLWVRRRRSSGGAR